MKKRKYTKKPIVLKEKDFDRFVESCENPPPPSERLSQAVQSTRNRMKPPVNGNVRSPSKYQSYDDIPELNRGDIENLILNDEKYKHNILPEQRRQRALDWWRKCG